MNEYHTIPGTELRAPVRRSTLYEEETRRFAELVAQERDLAYRRCGYTLLYGLPDDELVRERQRLGFEPEMPVDFYNLGVLANTEENHAQAANFYLKAIDRGFHLPQARYNLALSYEKLGKIGEAKREYEKYREMLKAKSSLSDEEQEDLKAVERHLAEL